jgi:hypothetical protein
MNQQIAIPTKNPGELLIPALGRTFQQVELREDDVFDTVQLESGAIAAGTELEWFRNVEDKNEQHTNIPQPRRIASGDEVAVFRIGVHPREAQGDILPTTLDVKKVFGNAHVLVKFNKRIITDGPAIKYPSGYGLSGSSNEVAAAGIAFHSVGVPSAAASPTLFVPQQLKDNDDITAKLRFPAAAWVAGYTVPTTANDLLVSIFLRGVIKSPLGK